MSVHRRLSVVLSMLVGIVLVPTVVLAQAPCECGPSSDCYAVCYVNATPHTCGELGMCLQIAQSCSSVCSGGGSYCDTSCFAGDYPDFNGTTCAGAGYSCSNPPECQHNMVNHLVTMSRWQYVETLGGTEWCHLYETRQNVKIDESSCEPKSPNEYGSCTVVELAGPVPGSQCCNGGCFGLPWPQTCS